MKKENLFFIFLAAILGLVFYRSGIFLGVFKSENEKKKKNFLISIF